MAVIHIFRDGTTTKELKEVYVPQELADEVVRLAGIRKEKKEDGCEADIRRKSNNQ
jgi:hypothetical protein